MAEDLGAQLEIQNAINKTIASRSKVLQRQATYLEGQVQLARELCNALECNELDGMEDRLASIRDGMSAASKSAADMASNQQSLGDAASKSGKEVDKNSSSVQKLANALKPARLAAVGFGVGAVDAFRGAAAQIKSTIKLAGSLARGIKNVGLSIVKAPFRVLGGLTKMANDAAQEGLALRKAYEDVRKTFGDLSSGPGADVTSAFKDLKRSGGDVAGTGLSMSKMFGMGPAGAAKALAYLGEQASGMGPAFHAFGGEIASMGDKFVAYTKGMGLSGEATGALARMAMTTGKSLEETLGEVSNYALQMGDAFGMSSKEIANDMATMAADVANFGQMAPKELAQVSVYAKRLGLEVKSLTGLIDKFDNFEGAAKSASMLSQAFGMNVDAMKMMNEQDPAKRMESLRTAFFNTGKSVEDLSRQELKLLSSQMGLDEASTKLALSNENMGYKDIQDAGKKSKDSTLTQAEAMGKLGKSIDRVAEIFQQFTGFFDALVKGFMRGVMYSKPFREMLSNLRQTLMIVWSHAIQLGDVFIKKFPGVLKMVNALKDMFDPTRWRTMMGGIVAVFRGTDDEIKAGTKTTTERLKEIWANFWGGSSGAGSRFLEGFKTFMGTLLIAFITAVPMVIKGLAGMIQKAADWLANPGSGASGTIGPALKNAFISAFESLKEALPQLYIAVKNLFSVLWTKYKGPIMKIGAVYGAVVIGKMLLMATLSAVKGAVVGKITGLLATFFGSTTKAAAKSAGSGGRAGAFGKALKKGFTSVANGARSFFTAIANLQPGVILKAGLSMAAAAVVFGGVMIVFALGLLAVAKILSSVSFGEIAKIFFGLGLAIAALVVMVPLASMLVADGGTMMAMATLGMLGGALMLTVGGLAFATALYIVTAALSGLSGKQIAIAMGTLAVASLALVGLVVAGSVIAGLGPAVFAAILGLTLAPLLLGAIGTNFIEAMKTIGVAASNMGDPVKIGLGFVAIGLAMVSLALMVAGAAAIGYMVANIPSAVIGLAAGAVLLMALPLILPAFGFVAKQIRSTKVNWKATARTFMQVAKIMGYLALMGVAAAAAGVASLLGAVGLGLSVYMLLALPPVIELLGASANATKGLGIKWPEVTETFWEVTKIMGYLGLLGVAAAVAGVSSLLGVAGLLLMLPFLASLPLMLLGLGNANMVFNALKLNGAEKNFEMMADAIHYIGLAGFRAVKAGVGALLGMFTIGAVIAFAEKLTEPGGLLDSVSSFDKGSAALTPALNTKLGFLGKFFEVLGMAGDMAIHLLPFTMPFIGTILMKGFDKIGDFAAKIAEFLVPAVVALSSIEMSSPAQFNQKVQALGEVFGILGDLAGLAQSLGAMDLAAVDEGAKAGTMLTAMNTMMSTLLTGTKDLIESTTDIVKNMSMEDVDKAARIGQLFAGIGAMVQAMMPPPEFFEAIKKVTKKSGGLAGAVLGTRETSDASSNAGPVIEAMGSYITKIMNSVKDSIPPLIRSVTSAASEIKNPAEMEPKIKLVASAIDIVAKVGTTMSTMSDIALKIQENAGEDTNIYSALSMFRTLMGSIKNAIKDNLKDIISSVTVAANQIDDPKTLEPKMKLIGSAMDVVVKFATTLKKVSTLMPSRDDMPDDDLACRLKTMTSTICEIVTAVSTYLPNLISTVVDMQMPDASRALTSKMKTILDAMEIVVKFSDVVTKIKGLAGETGGSVKDIMRTMVGDISALFQQGTGAESNTIPALMSTIASSGIAGQRNAMKRAARTMEPFGTFIEKYGEMIQSAQSSMAARSQVAAEAIVQIIQDYREIQAELGSGNVVGLAATLDRFGQNMTVTADSIRINNTPVSITVQLDLKIDSEKLTHHLATREGTSVVVTSNGRPNAGAPHGTSAVGTTNLYSNLASDR